MINNKLYWAALFVMVTFIASEVVTTKAVQTTLQFFTLGFVFITLTIFIQSEGGKN